MKRLTSILMTCALLCFLVLTGCNSSQGAKETASNQSTGENKAQGTKMKLVEEGTLVFASSGLYKPFNFKKDGQLTGFDVDIGNELAKRMGLKPKAVTNPWETIIQGLKGNKYDAIIGSMSITPERAAQVDFTDPYYISGAQIFVAESNNTIKSKEDLKDKVIGVVQSSTFKVLAEKYTKKIKSFPSDVYALQDLPPGRLDAVITDKMVGINAMNEQHLKIKPVGELLYEDKIGMAVNKGNTELLKQMNKALADMIADGTYEKISMKWFNRNILK
ncbi:MULTISPECIES: ABC transporter substrate-binding protein [Aneurinibacillus]|uniref:ABC transporter substrate-binding protein n=1 Tax=Aneurinibacillus thermoaerophilus TaxID=143495 RepID=A0A1G8D026_ANETH|nr:MULTISPECIES: ABC transporter substrate-binding protein [Aneurinibacillus]AMA72279.1 ABC transporter substrate-binding protein [Aneurinibacillus sp. XH2]MED0674872.1 ABC transporter substrate-binding protein [Aneurinibacillus thermoaerophilus]MED0679822.1 ABC transporter substrate-binding protein [Aneurinibacillus thermoaerophilus]MED0735854.1 ABC transporter substrate-binding protein [Aneurinibacillus thermoaerophilus]MED0758476.1 ABC transporter substrate-binding protein [Aneurinibacillus